MTRPYFTDEEQAIPPSGATWLDLAIAQVLLPDDKIDSKALHLPSGLRRVLRDKVINLLAIEEAAAKYALDYRGDSEANAEELIALIIKGNP